MEPFPSPTTERRTSPPLARRHISRTCPKINGATVDRASRRSPRINSRRPRTSPKSPTSKRRTSTHRKSGSAFPPTLRAVILTVRTLRSRQKCKIIIINLCTKCLRNKRVSRTNGNFAWVRTTLRANPGIGSSREQAPATLWANRATDTTPQSALTRAPTSFSHKRP